MSRIVFAGTPEFARESLRALIEAGIRPCTVLTQPDRPAGRGKRLRASPVKVFAETHGLPVLQPRSLRDAAIISQLDALEPDLLIVAAYGLLLPQAVLDLASVSCVNVHASILPRWRGAGPIQAAILAGDKRTGISLMQMQAGLDTGPVYAASALAIGRDETAGELHDRLAILGGELLIRHVGGILSGTLEPKAQDDTQATYAAKVQTVDARLDWGKSAEQLRRAVCAYNPHPGAWTTLDGERLKCWKADTITVAGAPAIPGSIVGASAAGIDVACGDGCLRMTELQRAGRNRITAAELAAQGLPQGLILG